MHPQKTKLLILTGFLGVLTGFPGSAAPLHGQSLADVARKEAERKKTVKDSGKVYTNKDLPQVPPPPAATLSQADTKSDTNSDSRTDASSIDQGREAARKPEEQKPLPGPTKEPAKEKDQAYWSQRMKDLRDQLDRDQTYVDALQSRVNALTTDFVSRDDPAQRSQVAVDRQKALSELDRLKKQIHDEKRAIADFEEEARRTGVPPGWLR